MRKTAAKPKSQRFPSGRNFLSVTQQLADAGSKLTDSFRTKAGKLYPKTLSETGNVLSILYRLACCGYGCRGGDHQVEWLVGKLVNQAVSAYRLTRAAQYDESLMVIRGMGEIGNLLWLFQHDKKELDAWKAADKATRLNQFGPGKIRGRLKKHLKIGPLIDDKRYQALCEVGTHPTPGLAPGHYTGTGRPVLGAIPQQAGILVCVNELAYVVAISGPPIASLLRCNRKLRKRIADHSVRLLETIGRFNVLNYEDAFKEIRANSSARTEGTDGASRST
jgi:hypothetical protein